MKIQHGSGARRAYHHSGMTTGVTEILSLAARPVRFDNEERKLAVSSIGLKVTHHSELSNQYRRSNRYHSNVALHSVRLAGYIHQ